MNQLLTPTNPDLTVYSKAELVELYQQAATQKEEFEATIEVVKDELILRLKSEKKDGDVINDTAVQIIKQVRFKTTVDQAREFGAVVTKETIDTKMLRHLHDQGVEVPGTNSSEYLKVQSLNKEAA